MNWFKFDNNNKKTWPVESEELFIIKTTDNRYEITNKINLELNIEAWAYVLPFEMKDSNIDDFISRGRQVSVCKPISFSEIHKKSFDVTIKEYVYLLSRLPVYDADTILQGGEIFSCFDEDLDHIESNFVLNKNFNFYLVDTQGYGYCRYVSYLSVKEVSNEA